MSLEKNKGGIVSQFEYEKVVGSVIFLLNYTTHDIAYVVSRLSTYTYNLDQNYWIALRRLLRALEGTIDYCAF